MRMRRYTSKESKKNPAIIRTENIIFVLVGLIHLEVGEKRQKLAAIFVTQKLVQGLVQRLRPVTHMCARACSGAQTTESNGSSHLQ